MLDFFTFSMFLFVEIMNFINWHKKTAYTEV